MLGFDTKAGTKDSQILTARKDGHFLKIIYEPTTQRHYYSQLQGWRNHLVKPAIGNASVWS